jgi:hypothetical protein
MPHHVYWACGKTCEKEYLETDCYGGGKYCAMEPTNEIINGRDIIMEDLRQKCLWTHLELAGTQLAWFKYIVRVHETCHNSIYEECSHRAHSYLKLDWKRTQECVNESFSCKEDSWDKATCHNSIIDAEIAYWKEFGTNQYPSVVINQKSYRGQIEPLSVFNAICAAYEEAPTVCEKILNRNERDSINLFYDQTAIA